MAAFIILICVSGYKLEFNKPVTQIKPPKTKFSFTEAHNITSVINILIAKGAVSPCVPIEGQFLSRLFLRQKSDGSSRFILNLVSLNKFIKTEYFKLENLKSVEKLLLPKYYMATVDLQDAYLLVPIHTSHRRYLRFVNLNNTYEFNALPFGLCSAPYVFTKLLKPVLGHLRNKGLTSVVYLDDFLCMGNTSEKCEHNVQSTISLLESLGFIINYKKSMLVPATRIKYLGIIIDTSNYVFELPSTKKNVHLRKLDKP